MSATWIIMMCLINCDDDIAAARRDGFSYEREIERNKQDITFGSWEDDLTGSEVRQAPVAALRGRQFFTQASCLAALKRALPARKYNSAISVTHYRDYVEESIWASWNQSQYYACYHHEPVVG